MAGVPEPRAVEQHPDPRRGEVAHLRGKLAALLAPKSKVARQLAIEKDERLANRHAVLCPAERERIHTRLPRDPTRRDTEARGGIGKARAIHVHPQVELARRFAERGDLVRCVHRAEFRRLRDTHRARFWVMHIAAAEDGGAHVRGRQFSERTRQRLERGAVGEKAGRTAFVADQVCMLVADHAFKRRAHRGERERIGRRSVEDKEDLAISLEDLPDQPLRLGRPCVRAVARRVSRICFLDRRPCLRADAGPVVAGELAGMLG